MRIAGQQLLRLPVYTEMGESIGRVHNFELDIDTHTIVAYLVVPATGATAIVKSIFTEMAPLRIARTQVVSISNERMVVKDAVIRTAESEMNDVSLVESDEQITGAL